MTDFNRIPSFSIINSGVCWDPLYSLQPRVAIANHWNRFRQPCGFDVWSNCPKGPAQREQRRYRDADAQRTAWRPPAASPTSPNTTTQLPYQCVFNNVALANGDAQAEGLGLDRQTRSAPTRKSPQGAPTTFVLWVDTNMQRPGNVKIPITANGTDVALIKATVVDASGNWCPTAGGGHHVERGPARHVPRRRGPVRGRRRRGRVALGRRPQP